MAAKPGARRPDRRRRPAGGAPRPPPSRRWASSASARPASASNWNAAAADAPGHGCSRRPRPIAGRQRMSRILCAWSPNWAIANWRRRYLSAKSPDPRSPGGNTSGEEPPPPPGGQAPLTAPPPPGGVRRETETGARIERRGRRQVGQRMATPRAPFAGRFGRAALARLDQALGREKEALTFRRPPTPWFARLAFAEPISAPEDMARVTFDVAARLCARLQTDGQGAQPL